MTGGHAKLWRELAKFLATGQRAGLVTILRVEGSSPREAGTRMLVRADGATLGTIGGGALEWQAQAQMQGLMATHLEGKEFAGKKFEGKGITRDFSLGPDLGQCCGGRVRLLLEAFSVEDTGWIGVLAEAEQSGPFRTSASADARGIFRRTLDAAVPLSSGREGSAPAIALQNGILQAGILHEQHGELPTPLLLFGAGHVGRALVLALTPLPFSLRWIDPRPDAFPSHFPMNVTPVASLDPICEIAAAEPGTLVLAMTHSHALDLELVAAALANPAIAFTGVIGSATKRARFASRLAALGHAPEAIARMTCPIGHPALRGKEPAVIAAGVAVQLLECRERADARQALLTARPLTRRA